MDVSARRRLFKALIKAGWTIGRTGGDHLRIKTPTGVVVAYTGDNAVGSARWPAPTGRPAAGRLALASDRAGR